MLEFVDWFIDKCGNNVSRSDYIEGYDAAGNTEKVFKEKNEVLQEQASAERDGPRPRRPEGLSAEACTGGFELKIYLFENRESFSKKSFEISLGNGRYLQAWCWRSNRFS